MNKMLTNELKNIASQWFVRLRSEECSESDRENYANWLKEDECHAEAYKIVETEWRELQELESWAAAEISQLEPQMVPHKRNWNIFYLFSSIAATAAIATLAFVFVSPLYKHDIQEYQTMKGEQRKIVLQDGSRVHLNSSSSMMVKFNNEVREINLQSGEGLFDVAHERNRPFIVKVRDNKIVAVGTSFNVHYKRDEISVTVLEGRVAIVPVEEPIDKVASNSSVDVEVSGVLVKPDQQVKVSRKGVVSALETVNAENITAWNRGLLILDNTPLREVAEEISRYIVGTVQVANNVPDHPVTGVIKITDQETMFQLLSEVVPITPVRQSTQLTMLYSSESINRN